MPFYVSMGRPSITSLSQPSSPYHYVSPDGGSVWKGPRKICCFCTLAIVLPALLISVPLMMRFVLYGNSKHFLNPSDMKILDDRISTTWCQGETVRANTTFTAYVTEGEPSLIDVPKRLMYNWNFIIPDDSKQYWGFYLLKGSRFKLRTCARHKGGTLLVVQGEKSLEYCAYIGEEDSAGNSDEISSSNSFEGTDTGRQGNRRTFSQEELSNILTKIRYYIKSNHKNHGLLTKHLAEWLLLENDGHDRRMSENGTDTQTSLDRLKSILQGAENHEEETTTEQTNHNSNKINETEAGTLHQNLTQLVASLSNVNDEEEIATPLEAGTIRRTRRTAEIRKKTESGENGAFEDNTEDRNDEVDGILGVVHPKFRHHPGAHGGSHIEWPSEEGHRVGILNHTLGDKDGSDSESESSFSSSEEALQKCEGVIATFNIIRDENCSPKGSFEELEIYMDGGPTLHVPGTEDQFLNYYEDIVNASGYYYFIFGSENEKRDNIMRAKFEMEKLVYNLPEPVKNCTNVKECQVDFNFASHQKVIIQLPDRFNHDATDQSFVAETECIPRTNLYMVFVFLVPIVILLCAFQ